ncbi:3-dehydroquinate synthase [Candidatus Micrarchaeota archaeon]|nr:3-dehydroquinate synthase [Candidatus Micrarchaeota archaeon]
MQTMSLDLGKSRVLVGSGALTQVKALAETDGKAFIAHQKATKAYAETLAKQMDGKTHLVQMPDGEAAKTLDQIAALYQEALDFGLERSDTVFAVGGGCLGDAVGFTAATYMRGVSLIHVPTTLLAQVDSAIGGKVGINFAGTKNMVGAFHFPKLVVCDIDTLESLPGEQVKNGLAEVVKYGLILDEDLFSFVEENKAGLLQKKPERLQHVVSQSVQIKGKVVAEDEREAGERMKLNYGHTLGHGIEAVTAMQHGKAISIGMHAAGILAVKRGLLKPKDLDRQNQLLIDVGLPLTARFDVSAVMEKVSHDKKKTQGKLRMVLLDAIGSCAVHDVSDDEARKALEEVLK